MISKRKVSQVAYKYFMGRLNWEKADALIISVLMNFYLILNKSPEINNKSRLAVGVEPEACPGMLFCSAGPQLLYSAGSSFTAFVFAALNCE